MGSDVWSLGCMIYQVLSGFAPFGQDLLRVYDRALGRQLKIPPGINVEAVDLITRMVIPDASARLGAKSVQDIRAHPYFNPVRCEGLRFEGAHLQAVPVLSLGELCVRAIGRKWAQLGSSATSWIKLHCAEVPTSIRGTFARYQKIHNKKVMRENRPMFTDFDQHADSEASSSAGEPRD